jgi:hypothetical protein
VPPVDAHAGAQPVGPEGIVLEDLADLVRALGLDDPQAAKRAVAWDLAHRAGDEHAVLDAVEKLEMTGKQLLPDLGDARLVFELHDEQHGPPSREPHHSRADVRRSARGLA